MQKEGRKHPKSAGNLNRINTSKRKIQLISTLQLLGGSAIVTETKSGHGRIQRTQKNSKRRSKDLRSLRRKTGTNLSVAEVTKLLLEI